MPQASGGHISGTADSVTRAMSHQNNHSDAIKSSLRRKPGVISQHGGITEQYNMQQGRISSLSLNRLWMEIMRSEGAERGIIILPMAAVLFNRVCRAPSQS